MGTQNTIISTTQPSFPWSVGDPLDAVPLNNAFIAQQNLIGSLSGAVQQVQAEIVAGSSAIASAAAAAASAASAAASAASAATVGGFRNVLINGGFDIKQNFNQTPTGTPIFVLDRWQTGFDGSGSVTTVFQSGTGGNALFNNIGLQFVLHYGVTTVGSGETTRTLTQKVEGVRQLGGMNCVVSFYAYVTSGTQTISVTLAQNFGTGGSPSATVTQSPQSVTLNTTPTRYSTFFALPTVNAKTLGSNVDDNLQLVLTLPSGVLFTAFIGGVQLESGTAASTFEILPPQVVTSLCERYFQFGTVATYGYAVGNITIGSTVGLPVTFRSLPTITVTATTLTNCGAPTLVVPFAQRLSQIIASAISTGTGACSFVANFTATAEL